jgi:hypothetical protein
MLCSEWWAYEFLTMFASLLGTADVAAQTIIIQVATLAFMVPLGLGIATTSLVGNSMGANRITLAKQISHIAVQAICCLELFVGCSIYLFGRNFVEIFTSNIDILRVVEKAIPFLSIFTFFDGLQGVTAGILRGVGRQTIGAMANVIAFYAIGLPCAYYICFTWGMGVRGLMMGISIGTLFQISVNLSLIYGFSDYLYKPIIAVKDGSQESIDESNNESLHGSIDNNESNDLKAYRKVNQRDFVIEDESDHIELGITNSNSNSNSNSNRSIRNSVSIDSSNN